jgi:hypothetical protein
MPQLLHTRLFRLDMKSISQGQSTHLYSRQRDIHVHLWSNRGCKLRTYELRVAVWRVLSMHGAATLPIQTRFLPSFTIFPSILLNFFASSPFKFFSTTFNPLFNRLAIHALRYIRHFIIPASRFYQYDTRRIGRFFFKPRFTASIN